MRLEDNVNAKRDQLKQVENKLKSQINQRNQEIIETKKIYDAKNESLRINQKKKEFEIYQSGNEKILKSSLEKQERLESLRKDLLEGQKMLEKEKQLISDKQESQIKNMLYQFDQNYKSKYQSSHLKAEIIKDKAQVNLNKMKEDNQLELQNETRASKRISDQIITKNRDLLEKQKQNDQIIFQKLKNKNSIALVKEEMKFENKMRRLYSSQAGESKNIESQHFSHLEKRKSYHSKLLLQGEKGFKVKLKTLMDAQKKVLSSVQSRLQDEVNKIEKTMSQKKVLIKERGEDDFYKIKVLNSDLQDHGDYYYLKLKIPKHEKEGLTFSANDRKLRINLQRSFSSEIKNEEGVINKSKRSELYSKIIKTHDLLDSAGIRTQYNDEAKTLEVVIKKA